ncbi:MAG: RimK/LysX family protein [Sulfurimonadaceae bacterium]|nr:RimK/LysX family protein [Sulfurimonadaceae bacterium]
MRAVRADTLSAFMFILLLCLPLNAAEQCNGKQLIGIKTEIALPGLGLNNIKAKVDTGARTSSLHCSDIVVDTLRKSVTCRPYGLARAVTFSYTRYDDVKSSNAVIEQRPFVMLETIVEGKRITAEFTLTDRSEMKMPALLGRTLLRGNFIVDVSR